MAAEAAWFCIGRLPDGTQIAVWTEGAGYRLGTVAGDGLPAAPTSDRGLLLAAAIGWFTEALPVDTSDQAASLQDLAGLVRWLHATATDPDEQAAINRATDAIDDGQPGEVVAAGLVAAGGASGRDPLEELLTRPASEPNTPASPSTPGRSSRRRRRGTGSC